MGADHVNVLGEINLNLKPYVKWLKKRGYQDSTIVVTIRNLILAYTDCAPLGKKGWAPATIDVTAEPYKSHLGRYLKFVQETRRQPLGSRFTLLLKRKGLKPIRDTNLQGPRRKTLLTLKSWENLRRRLRKYDGASDSNTGRLLLAYMSSPHRVTDFLRLRADKLDSGDVGDSASRGWLAGFGNVPLHEVLCSTERCAYYRLRTCLQNVSQDSGVVVDLDTVRKSYQALTAEPVRRKR
jgi:hypothetical protein